MRVVSQPGLTRILQQITGIGHSAKIVHKSILAEGNIGLMLPCDVIVYEKDGKTVLPINQPPRSKLPRYEMNVIISRASSRELTLVPRERD